MRNLVLATLVAVFAIGSSIGTTLAQDACQTQAVGKDGKPLAGAALNSFMKKCVANACAAKAIDKNGKKLGRGGKSQLHEKMPDWSLAIPSRQ